MSKYRYFAKVEELEDNKWLVTDVYMAEHDDPICLKFISEGLVESLGDAGCPGDIWRKRGGESDEF